MSSPLAPVGVFDSGVGGLTVARAIIDQLPDEDIIYVGDTANGPYGPLTIPEVRAHALAIGDDLVGRGVKALVIACNTASAACLRDARERYDVPVVEVILPAVRRAVATTRTGRIGVIGTQATITSHAYQDAFAAARDTEITAVACPRFVDFVERGVTSGRQVLGLAEGYLEPLQRAQVDTLVLGCTHYPLLSGLIQLAMGENVTLVSSAEETAKEVLRVLTERDLLRPHDAPPATRVFEATGDPEAFTKLAARFLGPAVTGVQPVHRHLVSIRCAERDSDHINAAMFFSWWYRAWHSSVRANYRARLLRQRGGSGFACVGIFASGARHSAAGPRLRRGRARGAAALRRPRLSSRAAVSSARRPLPGYAGSVRVAPLPPAEPLGKALLYGPSDTWSRLGAASSPYGGEIDDCSDIFDVRHWVDGEAVDHRRADA